jgi:uncharacterized protein (DUF433 family)
MAALDWSECPAVESVPGKVSGAWVFKGTRTPVAVVFENLENGMTIDEVMEQFPVSREQVKALVQDAVPELRPQGHRRCEIDRLSDDFGKLTPPTDELEKANRPAELDEEVYIAVNAAFVTDERPEERQPCDAVLLSGASSC